VIEEGCLSLPGCYEDIKRAGNITIEYFDRFGSKITQDMRGLLAIAVQHEIDHLNGHLFIEQALLPKTQKI